MPIKKEEKIWKVLLYIYILILIKLVVFKYPFRQLAEIAGSWEKGVILEGLSTANFTLGKSIRMYIRYFDRFPVLNGLANLVGNVLAFIPYGCLLPKAYPDCGKWWKVFFSGLILVVGIELFQLFSAFGAFDVDDILLNMAGILLGYLMFLGFERVNR